MDIIFREHNLTGGTRLANFSYPDNLDFTDNDGDVTCLTCLDGSLIVIKEMEYCQEYEKLHIKGQATVGTNITIINADTDEILTEGIRVREGTWEAEIENVGSTLENLTVMTTRGLQLTRKSRIVKATMIIMTINIKRVAKRLAPPFFVPSLYHSL